MKSSDDIRSEYVQHLLANVPKDTKGKFEIVEKSTVPPPSTVINDTGIYDSIEGYRIEIKKDGRSPTTMVLKKKNEEEIKKEREIKEKKEEKEKEEQMALEELEADDPDSLFETMMMLKGMNMDRDDSPVEKPFPVEKKPQPVATPKGLPIVENKATIAPAKPVSVSKKIVTENLPTPPLLEEKRSTSKEGDKPSSETPTKEDSSVINVTTQKPKKAVKKKSAVPELSLFGTIWTILDHMTTKATRIYLTELHTNHRRVDISTLLSENDLMDDSAYLRGQIFSERILDTYVIAYLFNINQT